jgi:ZIP family zinc transporter
VSTPLIELLLFTTLAGACIPLGGLLARFERIRPDWLEQDLRRFVIALGGGVLLGAVALVLVPRGIEDTGGGLAAPAWLLAGGLLYAGLERWLEARRIEAPQFVAMLSDFLPESLALGGMFAAGAEGAVLLALLIGVQNLPEGFNSWRELAATGTTRRILPRMVAIVPMGPLFGLAGWFALSDQPGVLGAILLLAAGGILYLTFQDIGPQVGGDKDHVPAIGAVAGFGVAVVGHVLTA